MANAPHRVAGRGFGALVCLNKIGVVARHAAVIAHAVNFAERRVQLVQLVIGIFATNGNIQMVVLIKGQTTRRHAIGHRRIMVAMHRPNHFLVNPCIILYPSAQHAHHRYRHNRTAIEPTAIGMGNIDPAIFLIVRMQRDIQHNAQIEPRALHAEYRIPNARRAGQWCTVLPVALNQRKSTGFFSDDQPPIGQGGKAIGSARQSRELLHRKIMMLRGHGAAGLLAK